eukprot:SAG31_NODE_2971_length_4839_cov_1.617722_4_plen_82_part_00
MFHGWMKFLGEQKPKSAALDRFENLKQNYVTASWPCIKWQQNAHSIAGQHNVGAKSLQKVCTAHVARRRPIAYDTTIITDD